MPETDKTVTELIELRDGFARQALPAVIQANADLAMALAKQGAGRIESLYDPDQLADQAYQHADAMMRRRQR